MTELDHNTIVDFIDEIFQRRGSESYLGEQVSMSQHMLQAAHLAEQESSDRVLIVAALLHDIGHYTSDFPEDALEKGSNNFHENAGADLLQTYFPRRVVDCIRYHVEAKRYLCTVEPNYYSTLSDASKHSLALQGGPMSSTEAEDFACLDHLDDIVKIRRWDDLGKNPEQKTKSFNDYRTLLLELTTEHYCANK